MRPDRLGHVVEGRWILKMKCRGSWTWSGKSVEIVSPKLIRSFGTRMKRMRRHGLAFEIATKIQIQTASIRRPCSRLIIRGRRRLIKLIWHALIMKLWLMKHDDRSARPFASSNAHHWSPVLIIDDVLVLDVLAHRYSVKSMRRSYSIFSSSSQRWTKICHARFEHASWGGGGDQIVLVIRSKFIRWRERKFVRMKKKTVRREIGN